MMTIFSSQGGSSSIGNFAVAFVRSVADRFGTVSPSDGPIPSRSPLVPSQPVCSMLSVQFDGPVENSAGVVQPTPVLSTSSVRPVGRRTHRSTESDDETYPG